MAAETNPDVAWWLVKVAATVRADAPPPVPQTADDYAAATAALNARVTDQWESLT